MFSGFGKRMDELMKSKKISNKQITEELQLSKNMIGNCKKNEIPSVRTLYLISQKLGVTMEYLLLGEEKKYTTEENRIIQAYNKAEESIKISVKKLLDIKEESKQEQSLESKIG